MVNKIKGCWTTFLIAIMLLPTRVYAYVGTNGDDIGGGGGSSTPPTETEVPSSASSALDYNILDWLFGPEATKRSLEDTIVIFTRFVYNAIFIMGSLFLGYRIAKALYMIFKSDVSRLNRKQMQNEIMEPIVGLVLLAIGWVVIGKFLEAGLGLAFGSR